MSIVTKQIQGNWQYGDGTPASGANLVLTLSQSAVLNDGSGSLAPQEVTIVLDSTGSIPSTVNIYYNDDLLPTGTFWTWVILTDADGQIFGPVSGQIIGTAPANLNAIIPISNVVAPTPAAPTFGPITVVQPAGTNLHVVVDSGGGGGGGGDVTITSPVDGSGNVKVAIESGISNPLPVSLPSATVTALTPPAAITGFAKESGGNLATIASALTNPLPVSLPSATVTTLTPPSASAIAGAFSNPLPVSGTFWQTTQSVNAGDVIDTTNSSTSTLAGGAVFTGAAKATAGFSQLVVAVDTDQPSASTSTTGIFVQWSEDGTNWGDYDGGSFSSSDAGLGQGYSYPIKRAYYRVVYTNGATLQTYFRLQSILKVNTSVGRLIDLIDTIDPNTHAQVVRSRQFGASAYGGGTFNDSVIKNPSTAAAATDPALVVSVSPNSPASLAAETTKVIGTVRALGNAGAVVDAAQGGTPPANALQTSAIAATALPAATTATKTVVPMADKFGRQVLVLQGDRALFTPFSVQSTAASPATLLASGGAGVFTDITELILTNEGAATIVSISDGTITYKFALAANGGLTKTFATPLPATSAATAWTISNSAAVNVDVVGVAVNNK